MHVVVISLYGGIIWLAAIAYSLITGGVWLGRIVFFGPFIISGAVVSLVALDWLSAKVVRLCKQWF